MNLEGEYRIPASREAVWAALNDPDVLRECIPGCQELEKVSDTELTATVISKIGPVKATFKGVVNLENLNPPEGYTITGEGKGGVAGFAKGSADVALAEDGSETVLTYAAKAQVGGKLAQLGSRLIGSTARKMADQFFGKFVETVGGGPAEQPEAEAPAAPAEAPSAPAETPAPPVQTPAAPAAAPTAAAEAPAEPSAERPAAPKPGTPAAAAAEAARRTVEAGPATGAQTGGIPRWAWIAGAVILVIVLYMLAT